ncbi:MAG: ABC transporter permease, partial [Myxococcales bacterium]
MFGELLRRLLWVPPMAVLVSLITFELIAEGPGSASRAPSRYAHLPRFLNPRPDDAAAQARRALEQLRTRDDDEAARTLERLGGAALPVALPALEGLSPEGRTRVVVALRPVARRMAGPGVVAGHAPGHRPQRHDHARTPL